MSPGRKGKGRENNIGSQISAMLGDAPVGICVLRGHNLVAEMATKAYLQLVDRKEEEFVGKSLYESLPSVRAAVEPLFKELFETGQPIHGNEFEVTLHRYGKSEQAFFNFIYQPDRDADGNVTGVTVVANEVTALVLAKKKLAESELKFRNVVMQSPIAMTILLGENFVVDMANEKMFRDIWRRSEQEVVGKKLLDIFPELNDQKYPELLRGVLKNGKPHFEKEALAYVQGADGMRRFYLDFSYEPLFDPDKKVFGIIITVTDVTDKVEYREQIETADARLRLAVEAADLGTFEVDVATNVVKRSARFDEIFGVTDHADRNDMVSVIHPDDLPIRAKAHADAKISGVLEYDARLINKDGAIKWIRAKGKYVNDANGKQVTLLGIVQDITEQKTFSEQLEQKVNERTEELQAATEEILATNEELAESNDNLAKANFELEQFNYAASHDLQEPLRKIQTFANILVELSKNSIDEKQSNYLKKIVLSAERMKAVMDDLLLYAHHAKAERNVVPTNLNAVVKTVLSDLELTIEQRKATIEVDDLPTIGTIPGQMHQLFLNLISNSLKFVSNEVAPVIRIKASPLSAKLLGERVSLSRKRNFVHVTIEDNGIGFEPKFAEQIFQLFKRLHNKSAYAGTGIGLALCKKIAENHNGDIFATSEPGKGTVMNVILEV